jgi:hypothetical protein
MELPQPHCQPFRDMLAHPVITPYLNTILGEGWRSHGRQSHSDATDYISSVILPTRY